VLTGSIPASISSLTNLGRFYARQNNLAGSIPATMTMPSLFDINLNYNQLSGTIPAISSLFAFEAQANLLTGSIPAQIFNSNLKVLWVFLLNIDLFFFIFFCCPPIAF
jgi:hypothetical protein